MRENAKETIEKFSNDRNCDVVILIGQNVSSEHVSRDIAIFSTSSNQLANEVSVLSNFISAYTYIFLYLI